MHAQPGIVSGPESALRLRIIRLWARKRGPGQETAIVFDVFEYRTHRGGRALRGWSTSLALLLMPRHLTDVALRA
jgi:hypothetical protein